MRRPSIRLLRPSTWQPAWGAARTLWRDYAHLRTVLRAECVDAQGQPIPWYTYPAIDFLKSLDFRGRRVFEYGSGYSTLFWGARAGSVVSVEDDERWYQKMAPRLPANCELILHEDLASYVEEIARHPGGFDVIVVDGAARGGTRLRCSRRALQALRPGGLIILDNSDWLPESARVLRESGLIEVDMTGLVPISDHTQTTSLFLHRQFAIPPAGPRQPLPGPGAVPKIWEYPEQLQAPVVEIGDETFSCVVRDEPFEFQTPAGTRRFRLVVAHPQGRNIVAFIDVDRQRVLLSVTEPSRPGGRSPADELERASRLPWPEFVSYINTHDKKRFRLSDARTA